MIETARLLLRAWRDADRAPYVGMMTDPEVGSWLGGPFDEAQANAQMDSFMAAPVAQVPGWMAVERREDGVFLGGACLREIIAGRPLAGEIEIGWRFARSAWGAGYATESARALLEHGFERVGILEIVAFTAVSNFRSQAVMKRLGLERRADLDFDHPVMEVAHPLRRHVVYAIARDGFRTPTAAP